MQYEKRKSEDVYSTLNRRWFYNVVLIKNDLYFILPILLKLLIQTLKRKKNKPLKIKSLNDIYNFHNSTYIFFLSLNFV